jgi:hypothetical protein
MHDRWLGELLQLFVEQRSELSQTNCTLTAKATTSNLQFYSLLGRLLMLETERPEHMKTRGLSNIVSVAYIRCSCLAQQYICAVLNTLIYHAFVDCNGTTSEVYVCHCCSKKLHFRASWRPQQEWTELKSINHGNGDSYLPPQLVHQRKAFEQSQYKRI